MEDVFNWSIIDNRNCRNAATVRRDCPDLEEANRHDFNCGGYALGTFDWYRPSSFDDKEDFDFWDDYEDFTDDYYSSGYYRLCDLLAENYVNDMLHDAHSNVLREVRNPDDVNLAANERLIAFRASAYDFHYVRQMSDGSWTHKQGSLRIEEFPEEDLEDFCWEGDSEWYSGQTHYLVVRDNTLVK